MKKIIIQILILIGLILLLVLALNVFKSSLTKKTPLPLPPIVAENPEGEADPARMTLTMTKWMWQKTTYADGRVIVPSKSDKFSLTFKDDGTVAISTDCNNGGGSYTTNGQALSFGGIMSTLMYCEGSQETEYFKMLGDVQNYRFTSRGELILGLGSGGGTSIFR